MPNLLELFEWVIQRLVQWLMCLLLALAAFRTQIMRGAAGALTFMPPTKAERLAGFIADHLNAPLELGLSLMTRCVPGSFATATWNSYWDAARRAVPKMAWHSTCVITRRERFRARRIARRDWVRALSAHGRKASLAARAVSDDGRIHRARYGHR